MDPILQFVLAVPPAVALYALGHWWAHQATTPTPPPAPPSWDFPLPGGGQRVYVIVDGSGAVLQVIPPTRSR